MFMNRRDHPHPGADPVSMPCNWVSTRFTLGIIMSEPGDRHVTPPIGLNLFVTSGITGMSIGEVIHAAVPWLSILLLFLILVTYVPQISTFLPGLLM